MTDKPKSAFAETLKWLAIVAVAAFALYLLAVPMVGGYINWKMTAQLRQSLEPGSTHSVNPPSLELLTEILSLHGYRKLNYLYGIPQLPNGIYDLFLNAGLVSLFVSLFAAGLALIILVPLRLVERWAKETDPEDVPPAASSFVSPVVSPMVSTSVTAPLKAPPMTAAPIIGESTENPTSAESTSKISGVGVSPTDLVGTTVLHLLATFVIVVLLIGNRISYSPSTWIESLFLLVQLPITAVIYPLSWMDARQINFATALSVMIANSVAASFCWHNLRNLIFQPRRTVIEELPPIFWGLAWILAAGTGYLAHRLPWDSFSSERRIWWFIVVYFLTAASILWLSLLLRRTRKTDQNSVLRAITGLALIGLLAGTVEGSIKPISIFFHSTDTSIETALLNSLKGSSNIGNQFITVGELSLADPTAEPRYHAEARQGGAHRLAQLDPTVEPEVTTKCFYRAEELAKFTVEEASKEVSLAVRMLQITPSDIFERLQKLKSELRDAAPSHPIDLETIKRFLRQQHHCALRKLTFFGGFAAPAIPVVSSIDYQDDDDSGLNEQARITLQEISK